ncbi:hypothetical protein GCM10023116_27220 [Kistimonas scapharcae]|uniref:Uncharacterized protein n=1 Tax=Kistimonas scapharcae TaxID=1036133 RepID=A0ABP8V349_9GAMM
MHHHLMSRLVVALAFSASSVLATDLANVSIIAQPLGKNEALENIEVFDVIQKTAMEDLVFSDGRYHFQYPIDQAVSLLFKREGYVTSQSGVFVVPKDGMSGDLGNIAWQAMPDWLWDSTRYVVERHTSERMKPGYCQLIATVSTHNKSLHEDSEHQGAAGTKVALVSDDWTERRKPHGAVFYFGTLAGKPQPIPGLDETSVEGGVVIMNIEPGHVYKVMANKPGIQFSSQYFACNPSAWTEAAPGETMIINLSPYNGADEVSEHHASQLVSLNESVTGDD